MKDKKTFQLCAIVVAAVFLFFFRAYFAFGVNWSTDEGCYLAQLGKYIGADTSQICLRENNFYAPGTALLWIPGGLFGKGVHQMLGGLLQEWVVPSLAIWSFLLWGIGLFFWLLGFQKSFGENVFGSKTRAIGLATAFNVPVLYYAVQTPLMAHAAEFCVASAFYFCFVSRYLSLSAFLAVLLVLIRYNDLPVVLLVLALAYSRTRAELKTRVLSLAALAAGAGFCLVFYIAFVKGYGGNTFFSLLKDASLKGLWIFLFDKNWGSVWVLPWWVLGLVLGSVWFRSLTIVGRVSLVWLWFEVLIYALWGGNGSRFGQRYLIGSYVSLLLVWKEILLFRPNLQRLFTAIVLMGAVWITFLTSAYESIPRLGFFSTRTMDGFLGFPLEALSAGLTIEFWKTVLGQQLPVLTLVATAHPEWGVLSTSRKLTGPGLGLLFLMTTLASLVLVHWVAANCSIFKIKKLEKKQVHLIL